MTEQEFHRFWNKLSICFPFDFKSDEEKKHWARVFKDLPSEPSERSIETYIKGQHREPPSAEYLAYLTRDCNGCPDLLYKAVKAKQMKGSIYED